MKVVFVFVVFVQRAGLEKDLMAYSESPSIRNGNIGNCSLQ